MNYTEELLWILDKTEAPFRHKEEKWKENIAFVHSLGLKCDCVGWCKLDLSNPRTPEILNSISLFCQEKHWNARGIYTREYIDIISDWYEVVPSDFKDNALCDPIETVTEKSEKISTDVIRAFHELTPAPKIGWGDGICFPERFRNFCIQQGLEDLKFCWAKDKGKYEAEQYFHVYPKQQIPQIAVDFELKKSDTHRILAAGGWLPKIADFFYELQYITLQDCYLTNDLPDKGVAYAYIPSTSSCVGRYTLLIHKEIVQSLLQNKILPTSAFRPAPVVTELPGGYVLQKTQPMNPPTNQFMDQMLLEYKNLKNTPRPIRMTSEKEALKLLRLAKKERKEDFQKALPKVKGQALFDTDYNVMVPYYTVANGGFLSDEYEFLSFSQAMEENEKFQEDLKKEEILDDKPEGIVIATCPDGDTILLCSNKKVVRFSHEVPEIIEEWPSLAQFFVDTINE